MGAVLQSEKIAIKNMTMGYIKRERPNVRPLGLTVGLIFPWP